MKSNENKVNKSDEELLKEINDLVCSGRMHLNLERGITYDDLTDEEKIDIMKVLNKSRNK